MQLRILFFPLVLKVLLYDLFIGILPYGIHIISARPEPTAPEHLLDLRMKAENFPGRDALHCSDYFLRGVHRYTLYQKMDMVPVQANFQEMNLVTLLDLKTNLFESLRNGIAQHFSPIFDNSFFSRIVIWFCYQNIMRLFLIIIAFSLSLTAMV